MKTKSLLKQLDHKRLIAAIQEAERGSSGDVVLFVSHKKIEDAMPAAHAMFQQLRLSDTEPQNSVLLFIAPESQKFAVIGGTDFHAKVSSEWWDSLVQIILAEFVKQDPTEGLIKGLSEIGDALRKYFPSESVVNRSGQSDLIED